MNENGTKHRPYVVLEQATLGQAIRDVLATAEIGLTQEQWETIDAHLGTGIDIYTVLTSTQARNSRHALIIVGRSYEKGLTPPLVAVSEAMFVPRQVNVDSIPKVSIA